MEHDLFKEILSRHISGVTVVTTLYEGAHYGFTASSVTSVSLEPPLLLFCIDKKAGGYNSFARCEQFAINFLASNQIEVGINFAKKDLDKFKFVKLISHENEIPILEGTCGYIILEKQSVFDAGDHSIITGRATTGFASYEKIGPLAYAGRKFIPIEQF
ncbi:MAG: flavin reductase family protein [Rickettsiaceae bacterium]|nr:flavin reductase family protein [Rickettsiaceae bacterium]